ncbi:hypothetical protein ACJ72_08815 [Emergomyces africanus]|uniref:Uncharacterized protein n=1 Tax=Emergomyces africanus TaxID=1955775 RepID=A0A1B7NJK4_9EURO|nr:hypothetical protein ACJ72_08815 [Emergomyces africanus]
MSDYKNRLCQLINRLDNSEWNYGHAVDEDCDDDLSSVGENNDPRDSGR